ncbi:hypothetical protein F0Q45_18800 [Mycobacterium simiae]|uniref:Uncharacterized protein n=1 Tax=Mycobacterium simiae TaxID=1784 RepID=A0A5B1BP42_MYCSI|nr:hypothetical protein [Mycobacterium simiae]KAA1248769.1 hypothetical protein F0Q45_18800 [Mycobacterium simiae]
MSSLRLYLDLVIDAAEALVARVPSPSWWVPLLGTALGALWVLAQLCRLVLGLTGPAVWLEQLSGSTVQLTSFWLSGWIDRLYAAALRETRI